ncbi:MAG: glycosyltransferase family 39 protein [Nitrosopumilaceae archaeon]
MSLAIKTNVFSGKESLVIFITTIVIGLISFVLLYLKDNYSLIYYGDAVSHLFIARKLVDSATPGISQIGTVWLPLPHLMLLPFSLVDQLYVNGIAGLVVSLPCHAATSVLIYKIIRNQIGLSHIALIGGFLYASNPNLIYLGITAMTEAPFLLFFVAFAYYFQKWNYGFNESENNLKYLFLASFFISLATLCRYEGWIVAMVFVSYVSYVIAKSQHIKKHKLSAILISLIAFSGMIFWLGWNQYSYDDPLEFANSQFYSASSQAAERTYRDYLYLQPLNVITIYGMALGMIAGPILLSIAVIGFVFYFKNKNQRTKLYVFLSLPPVFTIISLFSGIAEMSQWWFNARFATLILPFVLVLTAFALAKIVQKNRRIVIPVTIVAVFAFQLFTPMFGVVTFLDAQAGWTYKQTPYAIEAAEFLRSDYDNGQVMIMTGSSQAHRIMQVSGIHLVQFDEVIESVISKPSFMEPWLYDKWLIIGKEPDSDSENAVNYWMERTDILNQHYSLVFENQYYKIFLRE